MPKAEDSLGIVIADTNFDTKIQLYWGPNQNTEMFYTPPTGFDPFTLLSIPLVGRLLYYNQTIDTDDYEDPVPPVPPGPTVQSLWKLCWSFIIRINPGGCIDYRVAWILYRKSTTGGIEPPCLPFGQATYPGLPPLDDVGLPVGIYVFNCRSTEGPSSCACHPDCNIGFDVHQSFINPNPCAAQQTEFGYGCPPSGGAGRC